MNDPRPAEHLTYIRRIDDHLVAHCPEHRGIGSTHPVSHHGVNAVTTEARGHDDQVHGIYRTHDQHRHAMKRALE